jgi:hypothetical protein
LDGIANFLATRGGRGYYDNPPREEIVREIAVANGETAPC